MKAFAAVGLATLVAIGVGVGVKAGLPGQQEPASESTVVDSGQGVPERGDGPASTDDAGGSGALGGPALAEDTPATSPNAGPPAATDDEDADDEDEDDEDDEEDDRP